MKPKTHNKVPGTPWPPTWQIESYDFIRPNGITETIRSSPPLVDEHGRRFVDGTYQDDSRVYAGTVLRVSFKGLKKGAALERARKTLNEIYDTRILSFQDYQRIWVKPTQQEHEDYYSKPCFVSVPTRR
jgi:hypothetical protein